MIDIQTGSAAACTVPQCAELLPPLPEDTTRTNSWVPGEPLRFFVEVEHSTVTLLVKLGFIPPHQTRDLGTILAALNRVGVKPSISCSA